MAAALVLGAHICLACNLILILLVSIDLTQVKQSENHIRITQVFAKNAEMCCFYISRIDHNQTSS
jgi:hypothetical protein